MDIETLAGDPLVRLRLLVSNRRFAEARNEWGINLTDIAIATGIKQYRLAGISNLTLIPKEDEMIKIAIALEKPIDYLFPEELSNAIEAGVFHKRRVELAGKEVIAIMEKQRAALITDGGIEAVISKVDDEMLEGKINKVLGTLKPQEERIIRLRFGLIDGKAKTLEEVGLEFSVTSERIRQIESKALGRLRHHSRGLIKYYQGS